MHALQKAVKESHRECQECYEEGAASLREQHSELMHYGTIYKRLLKTAQSLVGAYRTPLHAVHLHTDRFINGFRHRCKSP